MKVRGKQAAFLKCLLRVASAPIGHDCFNIPEALGISLSRRYPLACIVALLSTSPISAHAVTCNDPAVLAAIPDAAQNWLQTYPIESGIPNERNFRVINSVEQNTFGDRIICKSTISFDTVTASGEIAKIEIRGLDYQVIDMGNGSLNVTTYRWPSRAELQDANNDYNRALVVDGETFEQAWAKKRATDAARQRAIDAENQRSAQQEAAREIAETRRRKGPCEASGGTWGYPTNAIGFRTGQLGCYFRTMRQ